MKHYLQEVLQVLVDDSFGDGVDVLQSVDAAFERRKGRQLDDALKLADVFDALRHLRDHHPNLEAGIMLMFVKMQPIYTSDAQRYSR